MLCNCKNINEKIYLKKIINLLYIKECNRYSICDDLCRSIISKLIRFAVYYILYVNILFDLFYSIFYKYPRMFNVTLINI